MMLSTRKQKTRQTLLNTTVMLILEKGYDQVTVTDIAESADYGRWTFYQYFKNKEDATYQAITSWMDEVDAYVVASVQQYESPRREYEAWYLLFQAVGQQLNFMQEIATGFHDDLMRQLKAHFVRQFSQHLTDGTYTLMEGVRPEIAAQLHVAAGIELIEYWTQHPELELETIAREFFIFMFNQPPPIK